MARRRLTVVTSPGCGLCDDALSRLRPVAALLGVDVVTADLATLPDPESYRERVPVVLTEHGVVAEGDIGVASAWWAVLRARVGRR